MRHIAQSHQNSIPAPQVALYGSEKNKRLAKGIISVLAPYVIAAVAVFVYHEQFPM